MNFVACGRSPILESKQSIALVLVSAPGLAGKWYTVKMIDETETFFVCII